VTSLKIPDYKPLFDNLKHATREDFQNFLGAIEIQPRHAHLSAEELASVDVLLLQLESFTRTGSKVAPVCISERSDLFQALDATLAETPGWDIIRMRAQQDDKQVEIFAICAIIHSKLQKK
jgi:hypothetical protein